MDLLRFSTAGSVDDGKSTLIGRLLYDAKGIFEDQLDALHRASRGGADAAPDLALLTDGLRAEREQGITIDVAYRYFATPRRKFIIADTPGHEQYTRNMATGASTAQASVVLVDARKGLQPQSRRHTCIAHLLGIRHLVVAVNKMDLVGYESAAFECIRAEMRDFAGRLGRRDLQVIPVSALNGDNVVTRSAAMPWYAGPSLLEHLEELAVDARGGDAPFRYPVQLVLRGAGDFRAYAGEVAAGAVRPGDTLTALPSGQRTRVTCIHTADGPRDAAHAGQGVALQLEDELDISRGDLLYAGSAPRVAREFDATLVWMADRPLVPGRPYLVKHTTRCVRARVTGVHHRTDVDSLAAMPAGTLTLNELGRVRISSAQPLFLDPYADHRATGCFIMIDPQSNDTVAAGMVCSDQPAALQPDPWGRPQVDRRLREAQHHHRAGVVWLTGRPGAGRRPLAEALEARLFRDGINAYVLDADRLRGGLSRDLGFTLAERSENLRRAAEVARILVDAGQLVIALCVTPTHAQQALVRAAVGDADFLEVFVDTPPGDIAAVRDPHGLYLSARAAEGDNDALIDVPYQPPLRPDLTLQHIGGDPFPAVERVHDLLAARGLIGGR